MNVYCLVNDANSGEPLEGAAVVAISDGAPRGWDTTDITGYYRIIELQTVSHNVEASKPGRQTQTQEDITVIADDSVRVNFALALSGCDYVPGDINGPGVNGLDVVYAIAYLRGGTPPPLDCNPPCLTYTNPDPPHQQLPLVDPFYAPMDVNGNCQANGIDITFFVGYLKGIQPALLFCPGCPPAGIAK